MIGKVKGSLFQRGRVWWLKYYAGEIDPGQGRRVVQMSLGTDSRDEAEDKAAELLGPTLLKDDASRQRKLVEQLDSKDHAAMEAAGRAESLRNRIPISDVWTRFPYKYTSPRRGSRRELSARNIEENQQAWGKFLRWSQAEHPEAKFLEQVTPAMAGEYSRHLLEDEHLSAGRHNKLLITAGVMFRLAGRVDPFSGVQRHTVRHESRANLECDQLVAVCAHVTGEMRRLFCVALFTGMRLSDCVLLRWAHIRKGRVIRTMAKTHKEISLPIHPTLQACLDEVPELERGEYVCPDLAGKYLRSHTRISQYVRAHFEKCNIPCVEDRETGTPRPLKPKGGRKKPSEKRKPGARRGISRYGFHSFRHSFITECARAGVPLGMIRDWVGHSSEQITKIYEHWGTTEGQQRILQALPRVFGTEGEIAAPTMPEKEVEALRRKVAAFVEKASPAELQRLQESMPSE